MGEGNKQNYHKFLKLLTSNNKKLNLKVDTISLWNKKYFIKMLKYICEYFER